MKAAVLTISDGCAAGVRQDESGPYLVQALRAAGWEIVAAAVVPDERPAIEQQLRQWTEGGEIDVILTTGGTGFSTRDVTPEATLAVVDRRSPGLAELLRAEGARHTPRAYLSRGEAGLRGTTLIVNLPGSLRAVTEGGAVLLPLLPHARAMIAGRSH